MTTVSGERRFPAPPDRIFRLLTDPAVIAGAMPAIRGHTVLDADHWEAKVKPPLPLVPALKIRFEVIERHEPTHAGLHAHGGGADVMSRFDLAAEGDGTLMRWETSVALSGPLGRFGGHGLEGVARHQADRTLDAVERAI